MTQDKLINKVVIRPGLPGDLDALRSLARKAGKGMTNLPDDVTVLRNRLVLSEESFSTVQEGKISDDASFILMLEGPGGIMGTALIFARAKSAHGFFNFKISRIVMFSPELDKRFTHEVLHLVQDFEGLSEVGGLVCAPEMRGQGIGRLLSLTRFLLIAQSPGIFSDTIFAELRGHAARDGRHPFWESLAQRFFGLDFVQADLHCSVHGNGFIHDLLPPYPILATFLSEEARSVMGRPHRDALPAMALLAKEGFTYENYIDVFDGGPIMQARQSAIRSIRRSVTTKMLCESVLRDPTGEYIIAAGSGLDFRAVHRAARIEEEGLCLAQADALALGIKEGEGLRYVPLY